MMQRRYEKYEDPVQAHLYYLLHLGPELSFNNCTNTCTTRSSTRWGGAGVAPEEQAGLLRGADGRGPSGGAE
uniref:Uncharacterized protein n=1 Tax=Arundo donax TaxID=35708 RepID=A0A0A8ZYD4_ARUDO